MGGQESGTPKKVEAERVEVKSGRPKEYKPRKWRQDWEAEREEAQRVEAEGVEAKSGRPKE